MIGYTCDLPACSTVSQPTTLQRAPRKYIHLSYSIAQIRNLAIFDSLRNMLLEYMEIVLHSDVNRSILHIFNRRKINLQIHDMEALYVSD
jgi:hypothetical protein